MISKDDLESAYEDPIQNSGNAEGYAGDVMIYAFGLSIVTSILTGFSVLVLGTVGIVLGAIIQLVAIYMILQKIFNEVDRLVVSRISRRERQIIESIENADNEPSE